MIRLSLLAASVLLSMSSFGLAQSAAPAPMPPSAPAAPTTTPPPIPAPTPAWSSAEAPATPQDAARLANEARTLMDQARRTYPSGSANIDQELWRKAADAIEAAVKMAPDNADYLRLRAQLYTEVGFWKRAEETWDAFFAVSPSAQGSAESRAAALAQYNLGYAAYVRNQLSTSFTYFQRCLALESKNIDCLTWAGRTALEQGDYGRARNFYTQAIQESPQNPVLRYFEQITSKATVYGPAATRSFAQAYGQLDAGRKNEALQGFLQAGQLAPSFIEAWREAGRLALELGNLPAASRAYQAATSLSTATNADRFNQRLVEEAQQFGLEAVRTFRAAYDAYSKGDKALAAQGFEQATTQNPNYAKAWSWLGRVRYENRNYADAAAAYEQAVRLDPTDKASAYFLDMSRKGK